VWVCIEAMVGLSVPNANSVGMNDSPRKVILPLGRETDVDFLARCTAQSWHLQRYGQAMKLPVISRLPTMTFPVMPVSGSLKVAEPLDKFSLDPFAQPLSVGSFSTLCPTDFGDELSHGEDDECSEQLLESNAHTSVILKNLPLDCTRKSLLEVLEEQGFIETVSFLYVPMTFDKTIVRSLRYAFISFKCGHMAEQFFQKFAGFTAWRNLVPHEGGCHPEWSSLQGLQGFIDRYRNSPIMHPSVPDEYKPVLLVRGTTVPFPLPSVALEAPHLRRRKGRS